MRNTNYQIDKCSVDKFFYRFGSKELFAGATIYSQNVKDFSQNHKVLKASKTNWKNFSNYFGHSSLEIVNENTNFDESHKKIFKEIQKKSYKEIKSQALKNDKILNSLFKGDEEFDDPYFANWLLIDDELTQKIPINFTVTKGSSSGGDNPTVVFKPLR